MVVAGCIHITNKTEHVSCKWGRKNLRGYFRCYLYHLFCVNRSTTLQENNAYKIKQRGCIKCFIYGYLCYKVINLS